MQGNLYTYWPGHPQTNNIPLLAKNSDIHGSSRCGCPGRQTNLTHNHNGAKSTPLIGCKSTTSIATVPGERL
jgi:hypothetical protein